MNTEPMSELSLKETQYLTGLKKKIRAKQKRLEKEWMKASNFRSENSISRLPGIASKKEQAIIDKIRKSRPSTSNRSELSLCSRPINSSSDYYL